MKINIKRPIAVIGLTYISTIAFATVSGIQHTFGLCALFFCMSLIFIFIKRIGKTIAFPLVLFIISISFGIFGLYKENVILPVQKDLDGMSVKVTAKLVDTYNFNGKIYRYNLAADNIEYQNNYGQIKFLAYSYTPIIMDYYDSVECTVNFSKVESETIDYGAYLYGKEVFLTGFIDSKQGINVTHVKDKPLQYYFLKLRDSFIDCLYKYIYEPSSDLSAAVLLGVKSGLSDEIISNFNDLSIGHIIVVSGLHISTIGMFIYNCLKRVCKSKWFLALISSFTVFLFVGITGFNYPAVRAGIMFVLYMLAEVLYKPSDGITSLSIAAIIISIFNPLAAGSSGFLMSFSTTLSIILFSDYISFYIKNRLLITNKTPSIVRKIIDTVSMSVSASIGLLPFSILMYRSFSPYFIISNILLIPLAEFLIALSLLILAAGFWETLGFISEFLGFAASLTGKLMLRISEILSTLPYSHIDINENYAFTVFMISLFIIILIIASLKLKKHRI